VPDKVTISYRGAGYEIGRGRQFYGIWTAGASGSQPLAWWPQTAEGWSAAWARFVAMEAPGSIAVVGRRGAADRRQPASLPSGITRSTIIAAALLAAGVVLGLAGLFPGYVGGQSLASQPFDLVAHLFYLAGWTACAVLILRGGVRLQAGALAGAGLSIVTLGMFVTDLGEKIAGAPAGAGLRLGLVGWLACTAGVGLALVLGPAGLPARPRSHEAGPFAMVLIAGIGAAAAFAPAWDSYVLRTASGTSETVTAGNAFAQPGAVIAGSVITMIALVVTVAAAALWRPSRMGALLLAGATIPMLAQAISAVIQLSQSTSPTLFGITQGQAAGLGLTISNGLTAAFWVYCVFVVALIASCVWMYLTPDHPAASGAPHGPAAWASPVPGAPAWGGTPWAGPAWTPAPWAGASGAAAPAPAAAAQGVLVTEDAPPAPGVLVTDEVPTAPAAVSFGEAPAAATAGDAPAAASAAAAQQAPAQADVPAAQESPAAQDTASASGESAPAPHGDEPGVGSSSD
jgi:hypothetical protein